MSAVQPGQVWADNDWLSKGRTLRVEAVSETHATCTVLTNVTAIQESLDNAHLDRRSDRRGNTVRILLRRFRPNSTGYVLVAEAGAMTALTDAEVENHVCCLRHALCTSDHFHQRDVEIIVIRHVTAALTEAADAIDAIRLVIQHIGVEDRTVSRASEQIRADAAAIVRNLIPTNSPPATAAPDG